MSSSLPWSEIAHHMTEYLYVITNSGYSHEEISSHKGAVMRNKKMLRKVRDGEIRSVKPTEDEILRTKIEKGELSATTWFLKGQTSKVVTCQPTPGGQLQQMLTKVFNPSGTKEQILVTEDGGTPVTSTLRQTDPFQEKGCRFKDHNCPVEEGSLNY